MTITRLVTIITLFVSFTLVNAALPKDQNIKRDSSGLPIVSVKIPAGILYGSFTKHDGPFLIEGSVVVPYGQVLEFGPGSVVYIGGEHTTIAVFGQILVKGTKEEPVVIMSAKEKPNPWDWNRIYCRSKSRSVFRYCSIKHSNYGLVVENGSAEIEHCNFERNSLHGLVIKNSDVILNASKFTGGHVLAILCQTGTTMQADSLIVRENISGMGCDNQSSIKISNGTISRNGTALVAASGASINIVGAELTGNKTGVLSEKEIPRRHREMVYDNTYDVKYVSSEEIRKALKEPDEVKSVVLPKTIAATASREGFAPGFSAVSLPQDPVASFIGNVTFGLGYYSPQSKAHPTETMPETTGVVVTGTDTSYTTMQIPVLRKQTRYLGEQSSSSFAGVQPEIQVFASGRRGNADINLLVDLYANEWLSSYNYMRKNMLNLSMNYNQQSLVFGDFFESGSETSISGRQMTGFKFTGNAWEMGGGTKRIDFKLAAGETEFPKDSGYNELDIYNTNVDSGMSVRQQITYIAQTGFKPSRYSSIGVKGIIARDQIDKPLFRKPLSDPGAPNPIQAQTGCIDGRMSLLNGVMEVFGEIDLGVHDTITETEHSNVTWYNPRIEKAVPRVFGLLNGEDFSKYYAITSGARGKIKDYDVGFTVAQIAPEYFSAGNPYLEADKRYVALTAERQINNQITANAAYMYERTSITEIPIDRNSLNLSSKLDLGEFAPSFAADLSIRYQQTNSSERYLEPQLDTATDSIKMVSQEAAYVDKEANSLIGIEGKQNLQNGMSYSLRYQILWDNDISEHGAQQYQDIGDGLQHSINGWYSFKYQKLLRNKTSFRLAFKNENRDSLSGVSYKIGDQLNLIVIPRKLSFTFSGEYSWKKDSEFLLESSSWQSLYTKAASGEVEAKYTLTPKLSTNIRAKYETSYDENEGSSDNYNAFIAGLHMTYLF